MPEGYFVDAPFPATVPKYGLLNHVIPLELSDPRWEGSGVMWEQDLCTTVESLVDSCPSDGYGLSEEDDLEFCSAEPFIIKGSFSCSTGGRAPQDAFTTAERRLFAWEGHELERVLWTGQAANGQINPSFAYGSERCGLIPEDISPEGCLHPVAAIALMEQRLSDIVPGGGMIHVPYGLASYLANASILEKEKDRAYTPTGTPLIIGSGYDGSGPGGVEAEAGCTWIYGTGPMGVWRSAHFMVPEDVAASVNRLTNKVSVFAERFYAVGFSCALFAVRVSLTIC